MWNCHRNARGHHDPQSALELLSLAHVVMFSLWLSAQLKTAVMRFIGELSCWPDAEQALNDGVVSVREKGKGGDSVCVLCQVQWQLLSAMISSWDYGVDVECVCTFMCAYMYLYVCVYVCGG